VSLLNLSNTGLFCVVRNNLDQKIATFKLGDICGLGECHLLERRGTLDLKSKNSGIFCLPCLLASLPSPGHPVQSGSHIQLICALKCFSCPQLSLLVQVSALKSLLYPHPPGIQSSLWESRSDCSSCLFHLWDLTSSFSL
jgi:hypothetical protein